MAKAFPKSRFFGFDDHDTSIEAARDSAKPKEYPGKDYDFVAVFDCLHDMGDPGVADHVSTLLRNDGTWMIVELFAHDELKDNLNPVGWVYYILDAALHALFTIAGSRTLLRRIIRRGTHARSCDLGLHSFPASHGNAFQYSLRSSALNG